MASSDVCSVVSQGPRWDRSGGPFDVHAVWQAWAVSLMSWSSRKSRDRVCACEPYYYDDLSRLLIEKDKDTPLPPPPSVIPPLPPLLVRPPSPPHPTTTHPVLTAVALRHRSHTNVALLSSPDLLKKKQIQRGRTRGGWESKELLARVCV